MIDKYLYKYLFPVAMLYFMSLVVYGVSSSDFKLALFGGFAIAFTLITRMFSNTIREKFSHLF